MSVASSRFETQLNDLTVEHLKRVNVVGLSGSGKSTFAQRFAKALRCDAIEMDRLFHGPNWTEPEEAEFRKRVSDAIAGDRWVLDGNYHSKTHDLKWERATLVVWVNPPLVRNLWQSTCRAFKRAWTQEELWPGTGNRETFRRNLFSRQSMILWVLLNYHRVQRRYSKLHENPDWSQIDFVELRRRQDADQLIHRAEQLIISSPRQPSKVPIC